MYSTVFKICIVYLMHVNEKNKMLFTLVINFNLMSISNLLSLQFIVTFWTEFSTWNIQIPKKIQHNSCGIHLLSCQITGGLESPLSHFALINQRGDSFNLFEARQFSVLRKPYKIRQKILKSIIFQTLFC